MKLNGVNNFSSFKKNPEMRKKHGTCQPPPATIVFIGNKEKLPMVKLICHKTTAIIEKPFAISTY